ncbi:MAG: hypothetical protein HYS08_02570, partial [Chlamydiae bacterium]|nr:hypothetical protein [Chlamydiota bacterium]MBI3266614.1 hypothetical protein [Chlamydiota bacterium]
MSKPVQTFVFLFTFLFLFSALCVQSTTVFKMNVPELVKGSCAIVIGEVEKIDKDFEEVPGTSPEEGLEVINTSLKIRVEKILKGC